MSRSSIWALILAGLATGPAAAQAPAELTIRPVRFYRAGDDQTRVWAFVDIPSTVAVMSATAARIVRLEPPSRLTVRVRDSAGLVLHRESWRVPVRAGGAASAELLHFAVAPGAYRIEAELAEPGSDRVIRGAAAVEGFRGDPGASDLLLAPAMRVAPAEAPLGWGEMRHGNTVAAPAALLRLTPERARAFYLLEAYLPAGGSAEGTMRVAVMNEAGKAVVETPPVSVALAAGGGVLRGSVDLTGLPMGRYSMRVRFETAGMTVEREAGVVMTGGRR